MRRALIALATVCVAASPASAEIIEAEADGFSLHFEAPVLMSADRLWARVMTPSAWWSSEHTYSGSASNLTLQPVAGGCWCEKWSGGEVEHGRILSLIPGKRIVLAAPFGPMQDMAVNAVMTISVENVGNGQSTLAMDFIATGAAFQSLDDYAPAVDAVQAAAFKSLASNG